MELKKVFSIFLIINFIISTIGISVYQHYCAGNIISSSLFEAKSCVSEEKSCAMKCCKDETLTFKIKDAFSSVIFDFDLQSVFNLLPNITFNYFNFEKIALEENTSNLIKAPPLLLKQIISITILFSSFLI